MSSELERAARKLVEADSVAITCHVGPDGDALGSMLGLAIAAEAQGKQVVASFGSPFVIPPSLRFLPTSSLVPPEDFPADPELMVVLDVGSPDRIGELASSALSAETLVVIDHHATNEGFGDVPVIDSGAAATGELVYDLLQLVGWKITPTIALCLHTALVTDSGRFQYSNTTPRTLRIAAELVEAGADPTVVGKHVYEQAPFGYLKVLSVATSRADLNEAKRVVSTHISQSDLSEIGVDWAETENLIDVIRLAVEADTAILVKAHADGSTKVSLRSRGDTDVGALAAAHGGGGHRLAAGFTGEGDPEVLLSQLIEEVEDYR